MNGFAKVVATMGAALIVACSSSGTKSSTPAGTGAFAPPAIGVQLASTPVSLDTGGEQYLCWSFLLPATTPLSIILTDPNIPHLGVHHYAVFTNSTPLPAQPAAYDCHVMDASWGLVTAGGVGTPGITFPEGTALPLAAGTHVVFQLHILNATGAPITVPTAAVNLVGSDATGLIPVGLLIAGTLDINIPAHMTDFPVNGGCPAPYALPNIFAVFPHMHQLGTRISMALTPAGATSPTMLVDKTWDFGNQGIYPASGAAAQGDKVEVTCHYANPGDNAVQFGESSTDEMCLGVLFYYPANPIGSTPGGSYCGLLSGGP